MSKPLPVGRGKKLGGILKTYGVGKKITEYFKKLLNY